MEGLGNYDAYSDEQLLVPLASGDVAAFEELYHRHWQSMYRFAWNILKEEAAATDLVQDVFLWLWTHRATANISHVKAYLHGAIKFKAANYIRSGKVRDSFFEEVRLKHAEPTSDSIEEELEIRELKAIIAHAVNQLPDKCREIFILSRDHGLSHREIAAQLGLSVKTVENQVGIALKKIRTSIDMRSGEKGWNMAASPKMLLEVMLLSGYGSVAS